jgi:hypothetical protein
MAGLLPAFSMPGNWRAGLLAVVWQYIPDARNAPFFVQRKRCKDRHQHWPDDENEPARRLATQTAKELKIPS